MLQEPANHCLFQITISWVITLSMYITHTESRVMRRFSFTLGTGIGRKSCEKESLVSRGYKPTLA